jgi:hypothetical protein
MFLKKKGAACDAYICDPTKGKFKALYMLPNGQFEKEITMIPSVQRRPGSLIVLNG